MTTPAPTRRDCSVADYGLRLDPWYWGRPSENGFALFGGPADPGGSVVLVARASGPGQRDSPPNQINYLRGVVERANRAVVGDPFTFTFVGRGWAGRWYTVLRAAAALAERERASLFAVNTERFVRSPSFNPKIKALRGERPDWVDFEWVRSATGNVPLLTYLHPDALPRDVESFERTLGQTASGNRGGRPPKRKPETKKQRREKLLKKVRDLRAGGLTEEEIAALVDVPRSTVGDWLRRAGEQHQRGSPGRSVGRGTGHR